MSARSVAEELVQAAAEALERAFPSCGSPFTYAHVALQAAFGKLPECEDARIQIIRRMTPCLARPLGPDDEPCLLLDNHAGDHGFAFPRAHYADAALAALAREFGDEEASRG